MSNNFVLITSFTVIGALFGLFGCDNDRNSDLICKNNPELCSDLHKDSWCRFEKGDLIRHRYALKQSSSPTGKQLYQQLVYLENYSKCIELAAGVQHKLNTDRTRDRERAKIDPDWFLALASIYRQQQNAEKEYLLTRANLLMSDNHADEEKLLAIINGNKTLATELDKQALELISAVMSKQFAQSRSEMLLK